MSNPILAVIGLGANLGDARQTLREAVAELAGLASEPLPGGEWIRVSCLYQSTPVGPPQPLYLNAAALIATALEPEALLRELQAIEIRHGRERLVRWGPRTLDLDLLWLEGRAVETVSLIVPHPELTRRAFALVPLLELVPHARNPHDGSPLAAAAGEIAREGLERVEGRIWSEGLPKL
jgi:2-amino-4-hydroxy-6-hydroxymethyldihydropteridine diphosphokinase